MNFQGRDGKSLCNSPVQQCIHLNLKKNPTIMHHLILNEQLTVLSDKITS